MSLAERIPARPSHLPQVAGAMRAAETDDAPREPAYEPYQPDQLTADLQRLRDNIPLLQSHGELRLSLAGAQN